MKATNVERNRVAMPRVKTPWEKAVLQANALTGAAAKNPHDKGGKSGPDRLIMKLCGIILQAVATAGEKSSGLMEQSDEPGREPISETGQERSKVEDDERVQCPEDHRGHPRKWHLECCLGCWWG